MEKIFLAYIQTLDQNDPNDRRELWELQELLALFAEARAKGQHGDEALKKMLGRFSLGLRSKINLQQISEAICYLLDRNLFVDSYRNGVLLEPNDCYDFIEALCATKSLLSELQTGTGSLLFFLQVNFKTNIYYVKLAIELAILSMMKISFEQFVNYYKDGTKAPGEMLKGYTRADCEESLVRLIQKKGGGGLALDHDRRFGHLDKGPVRTIEDVYQFLRDLADKIRHSDEIVPELMPEMEQEPPGTDLMNQEKEKEKEEEEIPPLVKTNTSHQGFSSNPSLKIETDIGLKFEMSEEEKMRAAGEATSFTTSISDKNLEQAFKVLGMNPSDDPDLIKKRYHQLAMKYHPDRFKDIDKDTALWQKSQRNFSIILKAYSIIKAYLEKR